MHLDSSNQLHLDGAHSSQCPHCGVQSPATVTAAPDFDALSRMRPRSAGFVLHCEACHAPIFRKHTVSRFSSERIYFSPDGEDVERRNDQIRMQYLPDVVGAYYNDAVGCYRAGLLQAFASMCRMTLQAMISASGERGDQMQLRLYDQFDEIASVVSMDDHIMLTVQDVLFDTSPESIYAAELDKGAAGILLEILKDLLHQTYIRHGKLGKALDMRRFFAARDSDNEDNFASRPVTSLRTAGSRSTGTDDS